MTLSPEDRHSLIRYRIDQAQETIEDVKILIENDRNRAAINRIYYGMFYALLALGTAYQFETSKHRQLIGWFNKNFIHKEVIEGKYGKMINQAYTLRSRGDYEIYVTFDEDTVIMLFEAMQEFIARIKQELKIS